MIIEIDHPVARDLLTRMRDRRTPPSEFSRHARSLGFILATEATRGLRTSPLVIQTPLEEMLGEVCCDPPVLIVVLRAGLALLDPFRDLLPDSPVGFAAVRRNESTAEPVWYYDSVPDAAGRRAVVLDPMLATGGTAGSIVRFLRKRGAGQVTVVSIVAAPEGVDAVRRLGDVVVITASVDRELDSRWYIRPGLGDCGDRLFSCLSCTDQASGPMDGARGGGSAE